MAKNKHQIEAIERKIPPHFTIGEDKLPQIKDWKVGHKYKIELEIEQRSLEFEGLDGDKMEARFEILKAKDITGKGNTAHKD